MNVGYLKLKVPPTTLTCNSQRLHFHAGHLLVQAQTMKMYIFHSDSEHRFSDMENVQCAKPAHSIYLTLTGVFFRLLIEVHHAVRYPKSRYSHGFMLHYRTFTLIKNEGITISQSCYQHDQARETKAHSYGISFSASGQTSVPRRRPHSNQRNKCFFFPSLSEAFHTV